MAVNFQIPIINHRKEEFAFSDLIEKMIFERTVSTTFTSGYFNPTPSVHKFITFKSQGIMVLLLSKLYFLKNSNLFLK